MNDVRAHQQLLRGFPESHHAPGCIEAALLPLRHQAHRLAEAYRSVPHPYAHAHVQKSDSL